MSTEHVAHSDIVRFADERVNLKREDAKAYREQVNRLRERLEQYLKEHPDFALRKMLLSGSLAKGTSLKSLSDIDVAMHVSTDSAPSELNELIPWLAARLRDAFPNFKPEQVVENPYTVTVLFSSSGLKVDVVPVFYDGNTDWKGDLVSKDTGERILTSIPMHIDFIRRRKDKNNVHFAQIVRLLKHWVKIRRTEDSEFRFKSFMIELVVAHLADQGTELNNYPEALAEIFAYMGKDGLKSPIVFSDNYKPALCSNGSDPVRIWDPVNFENNVAKRYTDSQRTAIVEAALDAGDAIDSALYATTKSDTLRYWRKVFGPTFEA